jgi:hypothetical protein
MYHYRGLASTISLPGVRVKYGKIADFQFTMDMSNPRANVPTNHPVGLIRNGAEQPTILVYETKQGGFLLDCNDGYKRIQFTVASDGSWIECYPFKGSTEKDIEDWLFRWLMTGASHLFTPCCRGKLCRTRHRVFKHEQLEKNKVERIVFSRAARADVQKFPNIYGYRLSPV